MTDSCVDDQSVLPEDSASVVKKASRLWEYFEKKDGRAKCLISGCPSSLSMGKNNTTTSGLKNHLYHKHRDIYKRLFSDNDSTITSTKQPPIKNFLDHAKNFIPKNEKEALTLAIVCHDLPFSFAEYSFVRSYIKSLNNSAQFFSADSITTLLNHCDLVMSRGGSFLGLDINSVLFRAAHVVKNKIDKYYQKCSSTLLLATVLDPRLKLEVLENSSDIEKAKELLQFEFKKYSASKTSGKNAEEVEKVPVEIDEDDDILFFQTKRKQKAFKIKSEVEEYLSKPVIDSKQDPLLWWKSIQKVYQILSDMAKNYLPICATSAPSERAFSQSKLTLTASRSSLLPKTVRGCMSVKAWATKK